MLGQRTIRAVLKRQDGKIVNELKIKRQADSVLGFLKGTDANVVIYVFMPTFPNVSISAVFLFTLVVGYYFLLIFAFSFTFPTLLDRRLLGTLVLPVAFALPPPILNIFPLHTVHFPEMPLRPFLVLTRFSSVISRLTLHFIQYPSVVNLS